MMSLAENKSPFCCPLKVIHTLTYIKSKTKKTSGFSSDLLRNILRIVFTALKYNSVCRNPTHASRYFIGFCVLIFMDWRPDARRNVLLLPHYLVFHLMEENNCI